MRQLQRLALGACLFCWACGGDTGQDFVELPLFVQGEGAEAFEAGAWSVRLTRAEVAVGPLYVCASESADRELCEVAVGEFLGAVRVDGLDGERRRAGVLSATTGSVRSALLDYGMPWLSTEQRPLALEAAPEGHSAVFEGEATRDGQQLSFALAVDLVPGQPGNTALQGRRTRHEIELGSGPLVLKISPSRWLSRIDFDAWQAASDPAQARLEAAAGEPPHEVVMLGMRVNAPVDFLWDAESAEGP